MSTTPSGRRLARGLLLTGVGVATILVIGYLTSRFTEPSETAQAPAANVADTGVTAAAAAPVDSTALASLDSTARAISAPATPATSVTPNPAVPRPAPPPSVAVADTGVWEFATANTWVRVRSAPTSASDVLRMVDSAQRVRLGPPMTNGWRPVRVGIDRGWVDPRFFTVVRALRP
jgi:uncharacterized protein YgiM (DUF1202 family)